MIPRNIVDAFRVAPGGGLSLADHNPDWAETEEMGALCGDDPKGYAKAIVRQNREVLWEAQAKLWADDTYAVLMVLQGMDAAGKDGVIKHVMSGVNPQGCHVVSFKRPSAEELDHSWLWRCQKAVPRRGQIGIFNRSHYEEVLIVKVHPEILEGRRLPPGKRDQTYWQRRYEDINAWEHHLVRSGTIVLKFFLHMSKPEQRRRFMRRIDNPEKQWKFSMSDVVERAYWDKYMAAFEDALNGTSTDWAPWYVMPANNKWVCRAIVGEILGQAIMDLGVTYPPLTGDQREELAVARKQLETED